MPRQRHVRRHSVAQCGFTGYPPKPRASGYWLLYSLELRSSPLLSPTVRNLQPLSCLWSKTDNVKAIIFKLLITIPVDNFAQTRGTKHV